MFPLAQEQGEYFPQRRSEQRQHKAEMPTNRQSGLLSRRQPDAACSQRNYSGEVAPVWLMRVIAVSQVPWMAVGEPC